jgi:hypothetical protein
MNPTMMVKWFQSQFPNQEWEIEVGSKAVRMSAVSKDRHGEETTVVVYYHGVFGNLSAAIRFGDGDPIPLAGVKLQDYVDPRQGLQEFTREVKLEVADMLATSQWIDDLF